MTIKLGFAEDSTLKLIEERMNQYMKDEDFRTNFLRDPVATLNHEGLFLAPEIEEAISHSCENLWGLPKYSHGSNLQEEGKFDPAISERPGP